VARLEIVDRVTIAELLDEAEGRKWGELGTSSDRTRFLIMCRRADRPAFQKRGETISLHEPVITLFFRPGAESEVLESQGLDLMSASYQIVDIARKDVEQWVAGLRGSDWLDHSVKITPIPAGIPVPTRMDFNSQTWSMWRHPELPKIDFFPMGMRPDHLVGRAFIFIPTGETPQALPNDVGTMVAKVSSRPADSASTQVLPATQQMQQGWTNEQMMAMQQAQMMQMQQIWMQQAMAAQGAMPNPPTQMPAQPVGQVIQATGQTIQPIPLSSTDAPKSTLSGPQDIISEITPSSTSTASTMEKEIDDLIAKLRGEGLEGSEILEHPEFQSASDRAVAAGVDEYSLFIKVAG